MNQDILNNMHVGEKAADIQEFYIDKNGEKLVYKVTIYTCRSLLFTSYISKYVFPFYFKTKELAEEFVQNHDKYKIDEFDEFDKQNNRYSSFIHYKIYPKNISFKKAYCEYILVKSSVADYNVTKLEKGGIWDGYIECQNKRHKSYYNYKKYYTEIEKLENTAAMENTVGQTFSYKLTEV